MHCAIYHSALLEAASRPSICLAPGEVHACSCADPERLTGSLGPGVLPAEHATKNRRAGCLLIFSQRQHGIWRGYGQLLPQLSLLAVQSGARNLQVRICTPQRTNDPAAQYIDSHAPFSTATCAAPAWMTDFPNVIHRTAAQRIIRHTPTKTPPHPSYRTTIAGNTQDRRQHRPIRS